MNLLPLAREKVAAGAVEAKGADEGFRHRVGGFFLGGEERLRRRRVVEAAAVAAGSIRSLALRGRLGRGPGDCGRPAAQAEQAGAVQKNVGQMQPHRPALGDFESLVEVLARAVEIARDGAPQGAGEVAAREDSCWPARRSKSTAAFTVLRGGGSPRSIGVDWRRGPG